MFTATSDLAVALDCCRDQLRLVANLLDQHFPHGQWNDVAAACRKQASVADRSIVQAEADAAVANINAIRSEAAHDGFQCEWCKRWNEAKGGDA